MAATMQTETAKLAASFAGVVNKEIEEFEKSDQSGIQAFGAKLRKMIMDAKLASKEWIHHSQVCPHEDNRDGELLIPIEVWKLLLKIIRKGWSYIECDKALSCGIPNNADGDRWKAKAMRLAGQSDGLLPPYLPERLTTATAAGSHTTGVLRLLDWAGTHQIPCPDEMFKSICPNGYLSQSQVLATQPTFKEPMEKGLEYFHIRHELVQLCPHLMRTLSQSDNAKHTVYCKESPMQTMLGIHRRAHETNAATDEAWERVAKSCARGLGDEFLPDVRAQCVFVEKLSGGPDGKYLRALDGFWKTLKNIRQIDPMFLKKLAESGNWIAQSPDVAIGCVMATLSAPSNFCHNGIADVFNAADLSAASGKKLAATRAAQNMMGMFQGIGDKIGVKNESAWHRIHGNFSSRLCMHVFGKTSPMRKTYKTSVDICVESYDELVSEFGVDRLAKAPCPWLKIPIASAGEEANASGRGLRVVHSGGALTLASVSAMGYNNGCVIRKIDVHAGTVSEFTIQEFDDAAKHAIVILKGDTRPHTLSFDTLIQYKIVGKSSKQVTVAS